MDRLGRLRGPLATVALAVLTLVALARVGLGLSEVVGVQASRAVAAARLAPNGGDAALTLLVGVLVVSCFLAPALPRRRTLAVWGALLAAVSVVATFVALGLTSLEVAGWGVVWLIPDLAVPAIVGIGLTVLARDPDPVGAVAAAGASGSSTVVGEPQETAAPVPDPELAPSWSEDTAAGAVWRTAGEAARGAPASSWASEGATWPLPDAPTSPDAGPVQSPAPSSTRPPALPAGRSSRDEPGAS